ncbi:MAG: RsbRD N-terminal domain-containing protein [Verrucomicrobiales bacterium]
MHTTPIPKLQPQSHPESVNGRLAKSLDSQRAEIINEWLDQVRQDPSIPTDSLTLVQVRDHLPQLFDDLTDTLSRYGSAEVAEQSEKDGEEHGAARWQQGFHLPEMLLELMHLRSILIHRLGLFEANNEDFGMVERLFVTATLHRFLDLMGINATEQFLTQGLQERERSPALA